MENCIDIVKEIVLKRVPLDDYSVFLFGSRVMGNNHQFSDIDIGIWGEKPISSVIKLELEQELEDSDIPYKVELIDFFNVKKQFKKFALEKVEVWNLTKNSQLSYQI